MSVVHEPSIGGTLRDHVQRIRVLERLVSSVPWTYVGTVGVDGIDALLTADSPPYNPPWTYIGAPWLPLRFRLLAPDDFQLEGGADGGTVGSIIFTVPLLSRPSGDLEIPASNSSGGFVSLKVEASTGNVTQVA